MAPHSASATTVVIHGPTNAPMTPSVTPAAIVSATARAADTGDSARPASMRIDHRGVHFKAAYLPRRHRHRENIIERRGGRADDDDLVAQLVGTDRPASGPRSAAARSRTACRTTRGGTATSRRHAGCDSRSAGAWQCAASRWPAHRARSKRQQPAAHPQTTVIHPELTWFAAERHGRRGDRQRRDRSSLITHEGHVPAPWAVGVEHGEVVRDGTGGGGKGRNRRHEDRPLLGLAAGCRHHPRQVPGRAGSCAAFERFGYRVARNHQRHAARRRRQLVVGLSRRSIPRPGRRTSSGRAR